MSRNAYRDFDEFADSIAGLAGRFVPTARSLSEWWIDVVRVGQLSVQELQIGGPSTFAGDGDFGTLTLGLPMSDPHRIRIDGEELDEWSFISLYHDQPFTFAGSDVTRWTGITLPMHGSLLAPEVIEAMQRGDGPRTHTQIPYLVRMRELVARVCSGSASVRLLGDSAKSAEQEIALCVAHALERCSRRCERTGANRKVPATRVISRCLSLMDASVGQALHVSDLCNATGVSERTLRNIFCDYFGVGPIRLLKVRQLREIRSALTAADPARTRVAQIAEDFGVWDLSLFARNYKRLFGESPSQTLARPPGRRDLDRISWLKCMGRIFIDDTLPAALANHEAGTGSGTGLAAAGVTDWRA